MKERTFNGFNPRVSITVKDGYITQLVHLGDTIQLDWSHSGSLKDIAFVIGQVWTNNWFPEFLSELCKDEIQHLKVAENVRYQIQISNLEARHNSFMNTLNKASS